MNATRPIILMALMALSLTACGSVRESLGLGRSSPDEFAVIDRPPLAMPPDFSLRPPRPGAPRPQDADISQTAYASLFNGNTPAGKAPAVSPLEKTLLLQMGADHADPNIRDVINRESAQKTDVSDHLIGDLLSSDKNGDNVVDAAAEAERLKQAKEKGEAINQTATPIIEHQESGFLGL
ncbi:MAG: DUF3035 domain-containing protein [Alphaproteobacteria bacterium]|nr:DUF3035 domain-containing protein [Alphaproteobacteria bacterium]MBV8548583.1 DUF3035 domain-containing protein [Alphaproteobacteria bacterium]